ncbi:MAG: hypothetical protein KJ621_03170 [Proteobacteria bacterium]|nr:hypothetical protein [Pseudomonadota bacterium]MBU1740350.1 hypothetical protein [Pseudomonadota bacterium]
MAKHGNCCPSDKEEALHKLGICSATSRGHRDATPTAHPKTGFSRGAIPHYRAAQVIVADPREHYDTV